MAHKKINKELLHVVFGAFFFIVLGVFAVGLDLLAAYTVKLGVSAFTAKLLSVSAHALAVLDLFLFFVHTFVTGYKLVKEMKK